MAQIPADNQVVYSETLKLLSEDPEGEMERLLEAILQYQKGPPTPNSV